MKILIVDDNQESLEKTELLFRRNNHRVHSAIGGMLALKKLRSEKYDIIISEIQMPAMDGFKLCKECKKDIELRNICFIFYTGTFVDDKDEEFALLLGAQRLIRKPQEPEVLHSIIKEIIEKKGNSQIVPKNIIEKDGREWHKLISERLVTKIENKNHDLENEIASYKSTLKALSASEIQYRRLFESAKDGILILDTDTGKVVDVNPYLINILHNNYEQIIGKAVWELGFLNDVIASYDKFYELCQREYVRYEDLPLKTADGKRVDVEFVSNVYLVNSNKVIQCNIRNISEHKIKEDQLKLFAVILEQLNRQDEWQILISDILKELKLFSGFDSVGIRLKNGNDYPYYLQYGFTEAILTEENRLCATNKYGSIDMDQDGMPVLECQCGVVLSGKTDSGKPYYTKGGSFWTNQFSELEEMGSNDDISTQTRNNCIHSGYMSVALLPIVTGNKTAGLLQFSCKQPDMFTLSLIEFYEKIASTIGIAYNRIQSGEKIRKSEIKYRDLVDNALVGVYRTSLEGEITYCNEAMLNILEFEGNDYKELNTNVSYRNSDERNLLINTIRDAGTINNFETELITYKGKKLHVVINGKLDGNQLSGMILDDTERKLAERELKKALEKAEERDKLKTAFLHNMSHEIRTPLNGIIGFSELLKNDDITRDDIAEFTDIIKRSGKRLIEIVNNVLEIARIETGQVQMEKRQININSILSDLFDFFAPLAKVKSLNLDYHIYKNDKKVLVYTDETKLHQILTNLINNAIKFTKSGSIDFGYVIKGNTVQFYVKDTGIGIPPEFMDKIFNRFIQVGQPLSNEHEGAGLGLAICKSLVELLEGRIWIESEINKGSTFYFTLPYTPDAIPARINITYTENTIKQTPGKILVVEDDLTSFMYLNKLLGKHDIFPLHAKNGKQAVDFVNNTPSIELILMDIKMPLMDGIEAMKKIKEIRPDLHVIALTAYAFTEERNNILSIGFDDYIAKPIGKEAILDVICNYMK